jgi:flagellar motor switch protein FliM
MSQDFLSRDEVDALMQGVGPNGAAAERATDRLRTVDLATQERATRARMPALDMVGERFAERLKAILFDELRRTPAITVVALRATRYGQLVEELGAPTHVTVVDMKPLAGHGLVTVDAGLVGVFVDALFGGGRVKAPADARAFTPTEERLIDRIVVLLLAAYGACWRDIAPLAPERVRTEVQPRFVQLCDADEMVYVARVAIDIGTGGGAMQIVLPRALLAPLRDKLQAPSRDDPGPSREAWRAPLSAAMTGVEIELAATLAARELKLSDLLAMKAGDLFPIDIPERVVALVNGVPMFECRYGIASGRYALSVTRVLPTAAASTTAP